MTESAIEPLAPGRAAEPDRPQELAVAATESVSRRTARARRLAFLLVALASLVPLAVVRYPPVTDLAQQMAQIPITIQALGPAADRYLIQWSAPNKLAYPLLAAGWLLGGPEAGARVGLGLCLIVAIGAIHYLAAALDRPVANAIAASVFVWSVNFYLGLFGFLLGLIGFALWLAELSQARLPTRRSVFLRALVAAFLLYQANLLWLLAATGLLILFALVVRETRAWFWLRCAALVPFFASAGAWLWTTDGWQIERGIRFEYPFLDRLLLVEHWVWSLLGGIRGLLELIVLGALALYALVAVFGRGATLPRDAHRPLLLAATAFLSAALLLPDSANETLALSVRWASLAAICAMLALPRWPFGRRWSVAAASLIVTVHLAGTTANWTRFDQEEMRGFDRCRRAIPSGARLLSLDFVRHSPRFYVALTFQMGAYAQLDRPVDLGFSFTEHRSSLVVERELPRPIRWTRKLEIFPTLLRPSDLDAFDHLLVRLPAGSTEQLLERYPRLEPVAGEGQWHLLRIRDRPSEG